MSDFTQPINTVFVTEADNSVTVASPGPKGDPGADGKTVLSGSGVPVAGLGVDGDFYIDTLASDLYGPKTAGVWGVPTSLIGPQGDTGETGPTGPTGPAGPAGVLGHVTYLDKFLFTYQSLTQWSSDFAVTFTAPASGKVLLSCQVTTFGSAGRFQWQESGTSTDHGELQYIRSNATDNAPRWLSVNVTGLTEDQSYTMVPATGRWSSGTAYFLGGRTYPTGSGNDAFYYAVAIGLPS